MSLPLAFLFVVILVLIHKLQMLQPGVRFLKGFLLDLNQGLIFLMEYSHSVFCVVIVTPWLFAFNWHGPFATMST